MEENDLKKHCKVLLIGGSAGSLEVLMAILPNLKPIINFAIVVILHRKSAEDSTLENLIAMKSTIPVAQVEDKEVLKSGFIYVAPSDYHLLFEKNKQLSLDVSEKVNYSRPSIDVSFESGAIAFGKKCTAILLSGANADGTEGLKAIQKAGGIVIVQNPENAAMPFMIQSVLSTMTPNHIMEVDELLDYINKIQ
ncbi:chemotaxis protein CheB [Flavobacterium antarcticum]|uniref:chemotaxis protein CheB n=1 Tax=Flavobacterium antarcticum TaxID=271155 RepID=UPI0003B4F3B2|nr:chemotaxis protein CheB [Flavobacterium antarcticum]